MESRKRQLRSDSGEQQRLKPEPKIISAPVIDQYFGQNYRSEMTSQEKDALKKQSYCEKTNQLQSKLENKYRLPLDMNPSLPKPKINLPVMKPKPKPTASFNSTFQTFNKETPNSQTHIKHFNQFLGI